MDAGASFNNYSSDITRTFPASGTFSAPQAKLYSALLKIQQQLIKSVCIESGFTFETLYQQSIRLYETEIIKAFGWDVNQRQLKQWIYPHHIGHWLGMDVHDCPMAGDALFEENMVVTVEPGIYIPPMDADDPHDVWKGIPVEYRGISIRIEDDVLVRARNQIPEILSANVPKTIDDIQKIMRSRSVA